MSSRPSEPAYLPQIYKAIVLHDPSKLLHSTMQLRIPSALISYIYISLILAIIHASSTKITIVASNSTANSDDAIVYKTIYGCAGTIQLSGNCGGPCSEWSGWLNSDKILLTVKGTNCVDTDGSTSFYACDALGGPEDGYSSCTLNTALSPTLQADGRWGYNAQGTNYLYLFSN